MSIRNLRAWLFVAGGAFALAINAALASRVLAEEPVAEQSTEEAKPAQEQGKIVYDEAKDGDLTSAETDAKPVLTASEPGVYIVQGSGIDALDDLDAFVFEVGGDKPFDFCLIADAAEFKHLYSIKADGSTEKVAFGSTNAKFGAPPNISKNGLAPGKYQVRMDFGPQGAIGNWIAKIAPRAGDAANESLCEPPAEPTTAEKMKKVDWPGLICIFHGNNWGEDKPYLLAIKEAGFGATGCAEWQIKEVAEQGMRAYVFLWPHEAATITKKHADNDAVLCYYFSDRIEPHKWGSWASVEKLAYPSDPRHPAIFTMYSLWGGMDHFCPTVRGRAMEYYQYHWDAARKPHMHFAFLDQYRQASAKNGHVPIIRIVEVRPEDMRKTRQTFYTCLAYGVRGFRTGGTGLFDVSKRDERGVPARTAFGEELKNINAAIKAYSPIYEKARCQAVYHTAPLPPGCAAAPDDSWVKIAGEEVLVGVFRDEPAEDGAAQGDYLLVANRDAFKPHAAKLTFTGKIEAVDRMDKAKAEWQSVKTAAEGGATTVEIPLEEGSGELLRVKRGT
jgi:hypothetical protein